ncbi:major facilitator superfamily domain-containing protein 10 [Dermatophagoides farinae]|uniref:Major facilitator superfamily domain-containing protein 10-like n=1 Tax=Dermatophagoides farinae TaxID=6954 RepID=A0A9D4P3S1_DERFA|nr:major facilitator superfamily domain-containing protein 10-like [Dermatophagoides farinae]KAH7642515.1 major facilitator superfamily domain-containing protein 10-like [Dermatophagoides farinae]
MNVNRFIFISLLIDLLAFTLILPLLPSLLECFAKQDTSGLYNYVDNFIQSTQQWIGGPQMFNRSLFGGLLGSLFSFLQFISMPIIGMLSDIYGRRPLYLICLTGISISYFFWSISINHFGIFVLFRILNGLSKGNVSLSTAIVTDVTTENKRGKGFATIGIAFSIGFIVGPMIGAILSKLHWSPPDGTGSFCFQLFPPIFAFILSLINMIFSYHYLPETLLPHKRATSLCNSLVDAFHYINPWSLFSFKIVKNLNTKEKSILRYGAFVNFSFLFIYSGLEFTLAFLTFIRFNFTSMDQGKLFFYVGFQMFLIQGVLLRRINHNYYNHLLLSGILLVIPAFIIVGYAQTITGLYLGLIPYAYSSAIVIPSLSTTFSSFGNSSQKGVLLGIFRSIGALARACGPMTMSFIFWRFGIETAYTIGSILLLIPLYLGYQYHIQCKTYRSTFE